MKIEYKNKLKQFLLIRLILLLRKKVYSFYYNRFETFDNQIFYAKISSSSEKEGYNIFGYFSKILGQAEIARSYVDEISSKEKFVLFDVYCTFHRRISNKEEKFYRSKYSKNLIYNKNIFFTDVQTIQHVIKECIPHVFINKYNILVFWWEFETGFEDMIPTLNEFDEIYVFSDFIKNILSKIKNRIFKITKIRYPFKINWEILQSADSIREKYHLKDKFCFFFNFDYLSSYNRKNPESILIALKNEFESEENVVLVLKTTNSDHLKNYEIQFKEKIINLGLSNRVVIINDFITRNELMTLLNSMDCYISLHRGEGLGLGILEAFNLNKPVVATNYGGNSEYMNNPLAFPVSYKIITANDDYEPYRNVQFWAEPDIDSARTQMRKVYELKMGTKTFLD